MIFAKSALSNSILFVFLTIAISCTYLVSANASSGSTLMTAPLHPGDLYLIKVVGAKRPLIVSGEATYALPTFVGPTGGYARYAMVIGAGEPLSVSETDESNPLTSSVVPCSVFDLSSIPPEMLKPLETDKVPVVKQVVASGIVPQLSSLYIINCAGDALTGGAGLGRGDAEYMDYKADGEGATDIGDGNTDYGVGVDETDLTKSPHNYKWGSFRTDHNYFLIYIGTGSPVSFLFFDSNYGDNSPTDTLTVKIYQAP